MEVIGVTSGRPPSVQSAWRLYGAVPDVRGASRRQGARQRHPHRGSPCRASRPHGCGVCQASGCRTKRKSRSDELTKRAPPPKDSLSAIACAPFFDARDDARDLVQGQVRMLRRVQVEVQSVTGTTASSASHDWFS